MDNYSEEMISLRRNWVSMWERCANPKNKGYAGYGGRGIRVCEEWADFKPFAEWALANGYQKGLQLDRINNDGDYSPDNCTYVTAKENSNNRRSNRYATAFGETKTVAQWAQDPRCVVEYSTLRRRLVSGDWIPEEAITLKNRKNRTRTCPQGHILTEETTYQRGNGYRMCAECAKMQQKFSYYREQLPDMLLKYRTRAFHEARNRVLLDLGILHDGGYHGQVEQIALAAGLIRERAHDEVGGHYVWK